MSTFARSAAFILLTVGLSAQAQLAQEPLLNRVNAVPPNMTLILDDSSSMKQTTIYEYGKADGNGPRGPGSGIYGPNSPDVNRLYYDPRVSYQPRPDFTGKPLAVGTIQDTWSVYFRKTSGPYKEGELTAAADYHDPYLPPSGLVVSGSTASYPVNVTSGTPPFTAFPKFVDRADCTYSATSCSLAEEQRNYTIWKKWYSNRLEMAKTGIALGFQPVKDGALRLGFATLTDLYANKKMARGVALYEEAKDATKDRFFSWLYGIPSKSGTPNISSVFNAGKYYERTDSDGPWGTTPNPDSTGIATATTVKSIEPVLDHASCRRSFSMLVTDGYWTDSTAVRKALPTMQEADTKWTITEKDKKFEYEPAKPYKRSSTDKSEKTLSDVAKHFWGRDLRPDLGNRVPEITGRNESFWQNVSFYAVTLGLRGALARDTTTWAKLTDPLDPLHWPEPNGGSPTTIDDTWHATVNGRGELLNANNASELTRAMKRMLQGISGAPQTLSSVAVSGATAKAGLRKYKPEYVAGSWTGNLSAIELDPATGKDLGVIWKVESGADLNGDPQSTIPAGRPAVTWNGSASVPFTAANTSLDADLVAYVRGDRNKELRMPGGIYRNRDARLGDIVNSSPVFVRDTLNMHYESLAGFGAPPVGSYEAFVTAKAKRPSAVFVGANDGMLHGFDDSNGAEIFAYVPQAVWPELGQLAETPYQHRYSVDGPLVEADAYLKGKWTNLLVGTTGAGPRAVFAIDVTDPLAPKLLWEINNKSKDFKNLGHVLSSVQTGLLPSGEWVAVFGNGFGGATDGASLYVVNLESGALIKEIDVGGSKTNGLAAVTVVNDDQRRIIGAYAGDLEGTLWKFDLKAKKEAGALFEAETSGLRYPITAAPAVLPHPKGGHVVTFGTGKFFAEADRDAPFYTQRLYGIWDSRGFDKKALKVKGTTSLTQQTVTPAAGKFSKISVAGINWGDGDKGVRGWYLDLPNEGQRLVYPVQRLSGTFVLATSISPKGEVAADICLQSGGGTAWSYIIDGVTGSGVSRPALDTNGDGVIDGGDQILSGFQHGINGSQTVIGKGDARAASKLCLANSGTTCEDVRLSCGQFGAEACPVGARQWRQLFMR